MPRTSFRPAVLATAVIFGATAVLGPVGTAHADEVSPKGKGVVGGALLGADIVTMTEGIAGVRPWWAYLVGGGLGAVGGGVGGYFIENASWSSNGRVPTYMLAGGLALIIPAVVLSLNATRYIPDVGATEDRVPATTPPPAEPGAPGGSVVAPGAAPEAPPPPTPAVAPPPPPPQSLLDVHEGAWRVGVPVPDVRPVFSVYEQRQYGMQAQTEVRMPVVHVTF